jgi:hypothetical protein
VERLGDDLLVTARPAHELNNPEEGK